MEITIIEYHSPEYYAMLALRHKVLREPWGLNFSEEDLQREKDDIFIACRENGCIIGCCILTRISNELVKLRQMAVDNHCRRKSAGMKILAFAEEYAAGHGYSTIKLHARKTAAVFYAKCGYAAVEEEFIEIGMPHILMEKQLRS
jgi:predicted GNAT family N-acyltransferase